MSTHPIASLINIGFQMHVRQWLGTKRPFVLVHGLSSNARTWDEVAERLAAAGHSVYAIDQRGHGLSDKPATGYDFATITSDLRRLLDTLELEKPILVGQSWGGNVMMAFGALHPGAAAGLVCVDGGTLDLQGMPNATWETVSAQLTPPNLNGTPRITLQEYIQREHPDWSEAGVEATLNNFETLPDGTVRPWLSLDRHMAILRAMWDSPPSHWYAQVQEPILLCMAETPDPEWTARKKAGVNAAAAAIPHLTTQWFPHTDHDIHVHKPGELAAALLAFVTTVETMSP